MALPIEEHLEIMTEYGRAFAYLNLLDSTLNLVLSTKGELRNAHMLMVNEILDEMMMGKKIKLAERFLSKNLIDNLWKLNDQRVLLAHGITGGGNELTIFHKRKAEPFTKAFLIKISESAKTLHDQIIQEIIS